MSGIFISYRRSDNPDATGRLYDRLVAEFAKAQVFKDVDSIPLGHDFRGHLNGIVSDCAVVLAIIGPRWTDARNDAGHRRLEDSNDFVRIGGDGVSPVDRSAAGPRLSQRRHTPRHGAPGAVGPDGCDSGPNVFRDHAANCSDRNAKRSMAGLDRCGCTGDRCHRACDSRHPASARNTTRRGASRQSRHGRGTCGHSRTHASEGSVATS